MLISATDSVCGEGTNHVSADCNKAVSFKPASGTSYFAVFIFFSLRDPQQEMQNLLALGLFLPRFAEHSRFYYRNAG